ncbi:DUF4440 domain-containing protein [Serratia sp. AKBS12]|uniref:DUF4440 domain-containing protein n=1 Tax=Serratia sp. AKBS12 TaxID=2974597 RepID=UPI0021665E71|nr:DUF4440 domain-containing protein [Serratia sp. AKBS12]MCS3407452.1 DUF4440 domain-containing protein [Serratia sp. AKBS12]
MNRYFNEVLDAHVAIENWLGQGEGQLDALLARFDAEFTLIALNGSKLDFPALRGFFQAHRAAKRGLRIAIEDMTLLAQWPDGAVVNYRERQTLPGQASTLRYSTVLFTRLDAQIRWRHLHETPLVG